MIYDFIIVLLPWIFAWIGMILTTTGIRYIPTSNTYHISKKQIALGFCSLITGMIIATIIDTSEISSNTIRIAIITGTFIGLICLKLGTKNW